MPSAQQQETTPRAIVPHLKIPADAAPYIAGSQCGACGEVVVGERRWCGRCGARDRMEPRRLAASGTVHAYTIVYRSYPGIAVPFVSCVVDLDGGGALRGTLIDVEPDPDRTAFGMPVDVVIRDAGRRDAAGNAYLAYFFRPKAQ